MIPWNTFNTPQDAYDWAKKHMPVVDNGRGLWFRLTAPFWSDSWWVLDQHGYSYANIRRIRR